MPKFFYLVRIVGIGESWERRAARGLGKKSSTRSGRKHASDRLGRREVEVEVERSQLVRRAFNSSLKFRLFLSLPPHLTHRVRCARPRSCPCRRRKGAPRPCRAPVEVFFGFNLMLSVRRSSFIGRRRWRRRTKNGFSPGHSSAF